MADQPPAHESRMLIDGRRVDGQAGTFANINPATAPIGDVHSCCSHNVATMISTGKWIRNKLYDVRPINATARFVGQRPSAPNLPPKNSTSPVPSASTSRGRHSTASATPTTKT